MFNFEKIENSTFEEIEEAMTGDAVLGDYLKKKIGDEIIIKKLRHRDTAPKLVSYYFDIHETIYKELDLTVLTKIITEYTKQNKVIKKLRELYKDVEKTKNNYKVKTVEKFIYTITTIKEIKKGLEGFFNCYDEEPEFELELNKSLNELPINNNKVLCLETGNIRNRTKEDLFNYYLKVDFVKETNFINNIVNQITKGSKEKELYLQLVFGYFFITGNPEQKFFYLHGSGSNSKSLFIETAGSILGDQFTSISKNLIEQQKTEQKPDDIAKNRGELYNKKLGICPELGENKKLNMTEIKNLTGGDSLSMRFLYANPKKMVNNCNIAMTGNHKTYIDINEFSNKRRFIYILFDSVFYTDEDKQEEERKTGKKISFGNGIYKKDTDLKNKLLEPKNKNQFFSWCVEGAKRYYQLKKQGLDPFKYGPQMKEEAEKYFGSIDNIGTYLKKYIKEDKNNKIYSNDLYNHFKTSEYYNNIGCITFNKLLRNKGLKSSADSTNTVWLGVNFIDNDETKEDLDIIEDCENIKEKERKITIKKLKEENEKIKNELKDTNELLEEYKKDLDQLKQQLKKDEVKEKPNNIKIIDDKQEKQTNIIKNLDNLTIEECKNILLKNRKENRKNEKVIPKTIYKDKNEEDIELELDFKKIEIKK